MQKQTRPKMQKQRLRVDNSSNIRHQRSKHTGESKKKNDEDEELEKRKKLDFSRLLQQVQSSIPKLNGIKDMLEKQKIPIEKKEKELEEELRKLAEIEQRLENDIGKLRTDLKFQKAVRKLKEKRANKIEMVNILNNIKRLLDKKLSIDNKTAMVDVRILFLIAREQKIKNAAAAVAALELQKELQKEVVRAALSPDDFEKYTREANILSKPFLRITNIEMLCELLRMDTPIEQISEQMSLDLEKDLNFETSTTETILEYRSIYERCSSTELSPVGSERSKCEQLREMTSQVQLFIDKSDTVRGQILRKGGTALKQMDLYLNVLWNHKPVDDTIGDEGDHKPVDDTIGDEGNKGDDMIMRRRSDLTVKRTILEIIRNGGQQIVETKNEAEKYRRQLITDPRDVSSDETKYQMSRMAKGDFNVLNVDWNTIQLENIENELKELDGLNNATAMGYKKDLEPKFQQMTKFQVIPPLFNRSLGEITKLFKSYPVIWKNWKMTKNSVPPKLPLRGASVLPILDKLYISCCRFNIHYIQQ